MSVKCIVIGDPHFKINNVVQTNEMTKAIISKAKEINPDFIVVAGDVLDRHEIIHVSPLTRAILFLKELSGVAPVYLIIGNHDRKNNRDFLSDEHPFTSLKVWDKNMKVIDTTYSQTINNKLFTFVPYVEPGRFFDALNINETRKKIIIKKTVSTVPTVSTPETLPGVRWKESEAIFAHQEIYGCKMGAVKSIVGDKWPISNPLLISGHIHEYQEPQVNVIYVGTPIQHGFGDQNDKTISVFKFFDNHYEHDRIDLNLRKKKIVNLNCDEIETFDINKYFNFDIKLVIKGLSSEIKVALKHINIKTWKNMGIKIVFKAIVLDNEEIINKKSSTSGVPLNFTQMLYNNIKDIEDFKDIFIDIFGDPF